MMATTATIIAAVLIGAAWRRWFGSARPEWAFTGYRAAQVAGGWGLLSAICLGTSPGAGLWAFGIAAAGIGFMTLPIRISREPFVRLARLLPLPTTDKLADPWRPMLQGPEPWGEVFQGATVWVLCVLLSAVLF